MTKKILAMFLAVLMVVSVLPASVLAAGNGCTIENGKHNLQNCTDYSVKEVVEAECGKTGHTLYECNLCHDTFIGDVKPAKEHVKVEKEAYLEPTYTEKGHQALYTCSLCNKDWFELNGAQIVLTEDTQALYEINVYAPNKEFECESEENEDGICLMETKGDPCAPGGMISTCKYCDRKIVSVADHTPDWTAVEIDADNKASAPCTVCDAKIEVKIFEAHDHTKPGTERATLEWVEEVKDCVTGGTIRHLRCVICDQRFKLESNGNLTPKTLSQLKGTKRTGGHVAPKVYSSCTDKATDTYDCIYCDAEDLPVTIVGLHNFKADKNNLENQVIEAKCGQDGVWKAKCTNCDVLGHEIVKMPEHTTLEEYLAAVEAIGNKTDLEELTEYDDACYKYQNGVKTGFLKDVVNTATCEAEGLYKWNCLTCGEERTLKSDKLVHEWSVANVGATCGRYAFTFEYYINTDCAACADKDVSVLTGADGKPYKISIEVSEVKIAEVKKDNAVVGYELKTEKKSIPVVVKDNKITFTGNSFDSSKHNWGELIEKKATCTEMGTKYQQCLDCPALINEREPMKDHKFELKTAESTAATCTKPGNNHYKCKDCDATKDEPVEIKVGYEFDKLDTAGQAIHTLEATPFQTQEATCLLRGFEAYKCTECNQRVFLTEAGTGEGHTDFLTKSLTAAGTLTFPAYEFVTKYTVTITAIDKNGNVVTSGKIKNNGNETGITVNGVTITNFGKATVVPYVAGSDLAFTFVAKNFKYTNSSDSSKSYEYSEFIVEVKYYTITAATCEDDGLIPERYCANTWCAENVENRYMFEEVKLDKLGHNYVYTAAQTTCTGAPLNGAKSQCSRCNGFETVDGVVLNGAQVNDANQANILNWNIYKATCDETDGGKALYDLFYCAACETFHIRNFLAVIPHNFVLDETKTEEATCSTPEKLYYYCSECNKEKIEEGEYALHENAAGVKFAGNCTSAAVTDRHCVNCCANLYNDVDCTEKNEDGSYKHACMIGAKHSAGYYNFEIPGNWNPATCDAPGYYIGKCDYCAAVQSSIPVFNPLVDGQKNEAGVHAEPAFKTDLENDFENDKLAQYDYNQTYINVDGKAYLSYTAATVYAAGSKTYVCATCGGTVTDEIKQLKNLQFYMVASNADAPECDEFAKYTLVALTIKVKGVDAQLTSFNMNVNYGANAKYVGFEWAENAPFLGAVTAPGAVGAINIVGSVFGIPALTVEDEALVTLYFRVEGNVAFSFEGDITAYDADKKSVESDKAGDDIVVADFMDVDGKNDGFLMDLTAALNVFLSSSYSAAADINRNGVIDIEDLKLMCEYHAGNLSVNQIYLLNAFEGEAELRGICTECTASVASHKVTCPEYVKP